MIITDLEIAAARDQLAAAERDLVEAELRKDEDGSRLALLDARIRRSRRDVEDKIAQQAQQRAALAERAERERSNTAALEAAGKRLAAARDSLRQRITSGDTLGAIQAAGPYNEALAKARDVMVGAGLHLDDDDGHATGVAKLLGRQLGIRLSGEWHESVEPIGLANWMHWRALAAAFGPFSDPANRARILPGVQQSVDRFDGLLRGLATPPALIGPRRNGRTTSRPGDAA